MTRTIEIVITPEGKATVQTLGFTGPSCREASKLIEQALGQQVAEKLTSEFYQAQVAQQVQQQQQSH